ncbi:MAG: vWA domain-containing protein [Candidatus Solibacter sp.]
MKQLPLLLLAGMLTGAQAQDGAMSVGGVTMLSCRLVSSRPCFRATVSFGRQLRNLPDGLLYKKTAIEFDGIPVKPFQVLSNDRVAGGRKSRTVMILLDISGSMGMKMSNGISRFETARQAVDGFVSNLDPEIDRVAVVPFDNHGVISTIRAARFLPGGEEGRSLLSALPNPRGDTALYAAIYYGIEALEQRQRTNPGGEFQLIVITDGKDDLGRDPDPELRQRPVSIDAVAQKAEQTSVLVYPIGIGSTEEGILDPLERISFEHSHLVQEPEDLIQILGQARQSVATGMRVTFLSPYATAGQLEGRQHSVRVLVGDTGDRVEATVAWIPVESMVAPQAREECSPGEKQALSLLGMPDDYTGVLRPLATLVVFAGILALCWFLMPRLMWPENFSEELPRVDGGARWSAGRQATVRKSAAVAGGPRQETDATYVMPRHESDSRSRFKQ